MRQRHFLPLFRHQHSHRDARHACQLAGVIGQLDLPDLGAAADVNGTCDAGDPAAGRSLARWGQVLNSYLFERKVESKSNLSRSFSSVFKSRIRLQPT